MEILLQYKLTMWTSMPNLMNYMHNNIDLLRKLDQYQLSEVKEFITSMHQAMVNHEKIVEDFISRVGFGTID